MYFEKQLDREEKLLLEDLHSGILSLVEFNQAIDELHAELRGQIEQRAQEEYYREIHGY